MAWTKDQERAINIRNKNVIVSAGAGSGKTAVLTERAFQIIKNHEAQVDELLILTFTKAAAHEMKERIIAALRKENYFSLADQVESANVTTFDAYALSLVKKYCYLLNLPSDISIIDESIMKIKEMEIVDEIFAYHYTQNDKEFQDFIKDFSSKSDADLRKYVINILHMADLKVDKEQFLTNKGQEVFQVAYIDKLLNTALSLFKDEISECEKLLNGFEDLEVVEAFETKFKVMLEAGTYDDFAMLLNNFSLPRFKLEENDKALKSLIVEKNIRPLKDLVKKLGMREDVVTLLTDSKYQNAYHYLFTMAKELDDKLSKFKLEKNSFTFMDIAKMALDLVKNPQVSQELKDNIKFIMVDEYQDTSDIQEALISALAHDNVFMVGDTKQSIYAFRNANCEIFQTKYENYKMHNGGEKIDLSCNFRSREEVVEDLNTMFSLLMNKKYGSVDYKIDHIASQGYRNYQENGQCSQDFHIEAMTYRNENTKLKNKEYEAHLIAEDIIRKVNEGYLVFDKNLQSLRPCTFKDFAILTDKKKTFDMFKKIFDTYQIPLKIYKDYSLISSKVGNFFIDALKVIKGIESPEMDVEFKHALVGLMRSFVYNMKDQEIYDTVINNKFKETQAYIDMKEVTKQKDKLPLSNLIQYLFSVTDIYNKLILLGDIKENELNVDRLYENAQNMEKLDYSFDDFLDYLVNIQENDIDIETNVDDEIENVVRLMSIHGSKGLEFPIIYFPLLTENFQKSGKENSKFKTSSLYGLLLPSLYLNRESLVKVLDDISKKSLQCSERMRLFYVALTRTKEKSILVINEEECKPIYALNHAHSFMDFINYYQTIATNKIVEHKSQLESLTLNIKQEEVKEEVHLNFYAEMPITTIAQTKLAKASKSIDSSVAQSSLDFGSELHLLLELVDFNKPDTSFIANSQYKKYIERVLALDVFKNLEHTSIFKEYAFVDDINQTKGVIDLLLIDDNEIKIIDYKTKNIEDEAYHHQLKVYENYIKTKFSKPVTTYLLAIIDAKLVKI